MVIGVRRGRVSSLTSTCGFCAAEGKRFRLASGLFLVEASRCIRGGWPRLVHDPRTPNSVDRRMPGLGDLYLPLGRRMGVEGSRRDETLI